MKNLPNRSKKKHSKTSKIQLFDITYRDYHHAGFDPVYGVWDQEWNKGDEWQTYPTVMVPDQDESKLLDSLVISS